MTATVTVTPKDFASDQEVRWCPGCGDYAILKAVQKTLASIGEDLSEMHPSVFCTASLRLGNSWIL